MRMEQDALAAERLAMAGGKQGWQPPPEHRQCRHTIEDGERCRRWANVGDTMCYKHFRYAGTDPLSPIKVPLLEDAASILLTLTQAVRAMALGTIPQANGRGVMYGCNIAEQVLKGQFERAKWMAEQRKEEAKAASHPVRDEAESGAPGMALATGPVEVVEPEPDAMAAESAQPEETEWVPEPEAEVPLRGVRPRFPDVKKNWDDALARAEGEMTGNYHPAEGESGREWLARMEKPIVPAHARGAEGVRAERAEWSGEEDVTAFQGVPKFATNGWSEKQIADWYYSRVEHPAPGTRKEADAFARMIVEAVEKRKAEESAERSGVSAPDDSAEEVPEAGSETPVLSPV